MSFDLIGTIKPYLEVIYFLTGGPGLAFIGYLALNQISVSKEASRTAALRDAYRISAEQTHVFATEIVPRLDALDQLIADEKITYFSDAEVIIEGNNIRINSKKDKDYSVQFRKIAPTCLEAVNRLETFSLYFTSKVAAEEIAFSSIGASYVSAVKTIMPFIIVGAHKKNNQSILSLFCLWHGRLEAERLEKERIALEMKMKKLEPQVVVPIGTN